MLITGLKLWSLKGILEDELKCEVYKDEFANLEKWKSDFGFWVEKHGVSLTAIKTWRKFSVILSKNKP